MKNIFVKQKIKTDSKSLIQKPDRIKQLQEELKLLKQENKKPRLKLEKSEGKQGLLVGIQKNGQKYSVRENRDRFFFPDEWMRFYDALKPQQKLTFEILVNTGARFNEAFNIKAGDCDFDRGNIILRVTKVKARDKQRNPRPRTISISSQLTKKLAKHIRDNKINNEDKLGLLSRPASHLCLKKTLIKIGIKDYYMFGLHNIRKTHGNWLKALGVDSGEICIRLGHDYGTFLKHYASPDIFNYKDLQNMRLIIGDIYQKK